jgi:hypothetical protein
MDWLEYTVFNNPLGVSGVLQNYGMPIPTCQEEAIENFRFLISENSMGNQFNPVVIDLLKVHPDYGAISEILNSRDDNKIGPFMNFNDGDVNQDIINKDERKQIIKDTVRDVVLAGILLYIIIKALK